jgi:hypothetical protein
MAAGRIFIHAWWRSGSTYVWSKIRENCSHICYYEPLHERISCLAPDVVAEPPNVELSRVFRHPVQQKNYFAEYAELVRANNLQFSPALSYDRYLLLPDQADEQLKAYIEGLLKAAVAANRPAALCFCRSQMRSAWLKKNFGGVHIAQIRNPSDQWVSFQVEDYFWKKMLLIALKLRQTHPFAFAHIEGFERFARYMSKRSDAVIESLFEKFISEKDALAIFLIIWMASALQAISFADFVLDIDQLSTDQNRRKGAMEWFKSIGCPINFSDCASPSSTKLPVPANDFERMLFDAATTIQTKATALVVAQPEIVRQRLESLSPRSGRILQLALEQQ